MQINPQDANSSYSLACGWSLANDTPDGLLCLKKALEAGFNDYDRLTQDGDIAILRKMPEFTLLVKKYFPDKIK